MTAKVTKHLFPVETLLAFLDEIKVDEFEYMAIRKGRRSMKKEIVDWAGREECVTKESLLEFLKTTQAYGE